MTCFDEMSKDDLIALIIARSSTVCPTYSFDQFFKFHFSYLFLDICRQHLPDPYTSNLRTFQIYLIYLRMEIRIVIFVFIGDW